MTEAPEPDEYTPADELAQMKELLVAVEGVPYEATQRMLRWLSGRLEDQRRANLARSERAMPAAVADHQVDGGQWTRER